MRGILPFLTRLFSKADEGDLYHILLGVGLGVIIIVIFVTIIVIRSRRKMNEKNKNSTFPKR